MPFFSLLLATLRTGTATFSVLLFALSGLLLVAGVILRVRARVRLEHLEHTPLNRIEFTHPHFPSPRAAVTIALCTATLLLAGLQTIEGTFPFNDPYEGLNLASFFLVGGAVAILAELEWKGTKEYASAAMLGTALAFLLLILHYSSPGATPGSKGTVLILLVPSICLAGSTFAPAQRRGALLTLLLTFAFWILVYLLQ